MMLRDHYDRGLQWGLAERMRIRATEYDHQCVWPIVFDDKRKNKKHQNLDFEIDGKKFKCGDEEMDPVFKTTTLDH